MLAYNDHSVPTTIRDIAKQLNMSVSTVSYALNNGPRPVPKEVRERVLKLAEELDYRPNRLAKSMVTGRTYTIGIVPTGQFENLIISPFMLSSLNGIVNECEKRKYDVLMFTRFDSREEFEVANSISDGRADGVIFVAPLAGSKVVEVAHKRNIPFVVTSGRTQNGSACLWVNNDCVVGKPLSTSLASGIAGLGTSTASKTRPTVPSEKQPLIVLRLEILRPATSGTSAANSRRPRE